MAVDPSTLINGTTADANQVEAKFDELFSNIDPSNVAPANKTGTGRFVLESLLTAAPALVPVGSIIPFYDFSGGLTFDSTYWKYCDGSITTILGIGPQTLPDLSGRYLVGFGVDGGGDIDTASWATSVVGNANHQINLAHTHTVNAHTHGRGNLLFNVSLFDNAAGTISFSVDGTSANTTMFYTTSTDASGILNPAGPVASYAAVANPTSDRQFVTYGGSGATDSASPGTNSQLSSTQSIQPRSIRVRFIMRVQ